MDSYEKRYKEALNKAKAAYGTGAYDDQTLEAMFPELTESEDERIRRELIEEVGYLIPHDEEYDDEGRVLPTYKKRIGRYRAWLEKQKEQEHPDGCFTCDEYKKGYEAGRLNGLTAGYNKAMKEQKPSWNVKDEKTLASIIDYLDRSDLVGYDEFIEFEEFLQSLRPSWKPSGEQMEALERASTNKYLSAKQFDILVSLHEDLNKL